MDEFLENLKSGDIVLQGQWRFELKSDFFPKEGLNRYSQEFYFFIPNALQINQETYSKEDFYKDLVHFIRYKTPIFTLKDLTRLEESPLLLIKKFIASPSSENRLNNEQALIYEIKLLGNAYRSSLREAVSSIIYSADSSPETLEVRGIALADEIDSLREEMESLRNALHEIYGESAISTTFRYVNEFASNTAEHLVTGLLNELRQKSISKALDTRLCSLILKEAEHSSQLKEKNKQAELLYRKGLLKKFVMDALSLSVIRHSTQARLASIISGFSAGIAMLVYLILFAFYGQAFVVTSQPFIILTVAAYILKDRLKEGLKALSYRHALKWFYDYSTEIRSPDEKERLGYLKESFTFVSEEEVPKEILSVRNREFHTMLPTFKRPEQVIYFKNNVLINPFHVHERNPFSGINVILRFNFQDFMEKASDPYHLYISLNANDLSVQTEMLPKIYHINLILKNSWIDENNRVNSVLKKFRFIIDKSGIKKIEHVSSIHQ